ncbi:MAG: carboxymuconolactone decarboxylase family protein [Intrasporangium sp.]|uniref:carboxymuconolactone decarboxylase family protein n=1 Tax=Intrasporangium sp. TaxID=1925024 RepID=UPI003F80568F
MSSTARIPLEHPDTIITRAVRWWSKRKFGAVLEPGLALMHHRRILMSMSRFEMGVEHWRSLDAGLKDLAIASVSARIGCSWCIDFGYYLSRSHGMEVAKLEQLTQWRTSDVYSPLERRVLEYAEAMTATPPEVTDEMVEGLRKDLTNEQLVELTAMISLENMRSRTNSALGLTSQGFKDHCEVPVG